MALEFKPIPKHNIIYQLIPKYLLAAWFSTRFADEVANEFKSFKQALVGFIGILENIYNKRETLFHTGQIASR